MGGGGKAAFTKGAKKSTGKSSNKRAGLTFPVSRVGRYMKKGRFAARVGGAAPVFMAAVLEYLVAELLELAGNTARAHKKNRILPRHLQLAINDDDELEKLLGKVTIAGGGVAPGLHQFLEDKLKEKKAKKNKKKAERAASKASLMDYE